VSLGRKRGGHPLEVTVPIADVIEALWPGAARYLWIASAVALAAVACAAVALFITNH
jgi:hypothetical protein